MSMQGMGDPKEMGRGLLRQGEFDQAAAALREAVMMDGSDEEAWRLLGGALASKGDANGAVDAFKQAVELSPQAGRSHYNLALAYQSAERLSDAKASLERALTLDPGYEQARTRLAEIDRQMGVSAPAAAPVGLSSVGAAPGLGGLSGVGAAPAQDTGYTNIGGGNTSTLSSLGGMSGGLSAPETGHTNIGGGNSAALGGLSGGAPSSAGPTLRTEPPPSYGGAGTGYAPPPSLGMNYGDTKNTSGMGGEVPPELQRITFNWGAFAFSWIWAFRMKLRPLGIAYLIGGVIVRSIDRSSHVPALNLLLGMLHFAALLALGFAGNKLAWKNRQFESLEDFYSCQRTWMYWAVGIIAVAFIIGLIIGVAGTMSALPGMK